MHELGEILGETVRPIHAEAVTVPVQRHKHGREVALGSPCPLRQSEPAER